MENQDLQGCGLWAAEDVDCFSNFKQIEGGRLVGAPLMIPSQLYGRKFNFAITEYEYKKLPISSDV